MWTLRDPQDQIFGIITSPSGGALLYPEGYFLWGGIPYPHVHAQLACSYLDRGEQDRAIHMARFQRLLCDHRGVLIPSIWMQESSKLIEVAQQQTERLFERVGFLEKPTHEEDPLLGLVHHAWDQGVLVITGTGCITGLGSYLFRDAGIISFGPQLSPLGDPSQYGIAGKPWDWNSHGFAYQYTNRLAIPHTRHTGLPWVQDAGYSDSWIRVHHRIDQHMLWTEIRAIGSKPPRHWTVLGLGERCIVNHSHGLRARSLDRYSGPLDSVEFCGVAGSVNITFDDRPGYMEIHPLAGKDQFWGADFLITCTLQDPYHMGPWCFSYHPH